jgi:acyl-CoA synthetase (NDP forming)
MELQERIRAMEKVFSPKSVAFVGASNNLGKWGGIIFHNLLDGGYEGAIYPVNPKEETVQGRKAFRSVGEIPGEVDLAIFTIPSASVPEAIRECVKKKVPAGIVITAGFAELGDEGGALQQEMVRLARSGGMALVGPNGQGISSPRAKLHPWMPVFQPAPGVIAVVSQSGNVSTVMAEGLSDFGFGCSKAVSAGNCADLNWPDYLEFFRQDPETKVIMLYVEGVGDGPAFFKAAKAAALEKPVVIIKSGRTSAGAAAAASHTGVLAGSDEVFSAACKQAGLTRAETIEDAVIYAASFVKTPLPEGKRVGVITGGGGYGVIAADACMRLGLDVVKLSDQTIAKLKAHLPPWWSPNNPVDMVAGIGFGGPRELIPILMESGEVDGVILLGIGWIYSMLDSVTSKIDFKNPEDKALLARLDHDLKYNEILRDYFFKFDKPLLMTSTMARLAVRRGYPGLLKLVDQGIMLYPTIEDSVRAFGALAERGRFLRQEKNLQCSPHED